MASSQTRAIILGVLGGVAFSALLAGAFYVGRVSHAPILPATSPPVQAEVPKADEGGSQDAEPEGDNGQPSAEAQTPEVAFAKDFEAFLNSFLKGLAKQTAQYKKDRRILKEAINPYNLIGTENAEQSYTIFRDEIGPMLRNKSERLLSVFAESEKVVQGLLEDKSAATKDRLFSAWKNLEKEHMNGLLDFIENEDRLITAHEELLKFYFVHSKLYKVDMDSGKIVFSNEKYTAREAELLGNIEKLRRGNDKRKSP